MPGAVPDRQRVQDNHVPQQHACPRGRSCLEHSYLTCFSPPCHQWGVCSAPEPSVTFHTKCEPNTGYLDNSCARITLIFNREKVPQVSERVCALIRTIFFFK